MPNVAIHRPLALKEGWVIVSAMASKVRQDLPVEHITVRLECWGRQGETLASHNGQEVRVFGGIPGEEVEAEVITGRRDYIAARVTRVIEPSPHRIEAPCSYFGSCTGCQWQHVDYQHQLRTKRSMVVEALERAGGFDVSLVHPTLPSPEEYGYRNHARFTVGRRYGELGFVNRESRRFVVVDRCLLMHPWINDALGLLQRKCAETSQLSLRYGVNTGDFLVQPVLKTEEVCLVSGQTHYSERLDGREFRVASSSFFQVNTRQAERILELVKDGLRLSGRESVVDAYAGVGVFAVMLAPHTGQVVAIEDSASAVQDAEANAEGIDNLRFIHGKTEEVLALMEEPPDGLILDPPRVGCRPNALEAVIRLAPERVVYVSCDPEALARDLKVLCGPYRLESVQPVDMFPQTHHIECVATLVWDGHAAEPGAPAAQHSSPQSDVVLASTSPRRRELLAQLGLEFSVVAPDVAEDTQDGESPGDMVERLALSKARKVASSRTSGLVVGADSTVVLDGEALGKPRDEDEAAEMLSRLRNREHQVVTGVAVVGAGGGSERVASLVSHVTMRNYSDGEVAAYVASGEPMDKAGAYAVQDPAFRPAAHVDGCYTNVVGLPLCTLTDLLADAGLGEEWTHHAPATDGCSRCPLKASGPGEGVHPN